jgi:hypothetical protein
MMGQDVLRDAQLYRLSKRQCHDSFPQKKMPFCFNHPRDPDMKPRSQKMGSLKDFEICGVLEKEPLHNGQKLSTCWAWSFA